jgi:hypothetical protein
MKHEGEFDTSYFHKTHIQGVKYSLFIMVLEEMMFMESKGQPRVALAASPPILAVFRLVSCVLFFSVSPS